MRDEMETGTKQSKILEKHLPDEVYKVFKQYGSEQLCFNQHAVLKDDFHVDQFISDCKKRVSLQTLREDLEKHYKNIRVALIEIINHDYADFVNLSSNLVGVEKSLENLNGPLSQLKEEVGVVQRDLYKVLSSIEQRLQERREVREQKTRLQHLLNVISSLEKIEKILGADPKSHEVEMFMEAGRNSPGHFLERIAGEFNQLQFHVNQSKGHPIIEDIRPRVALITSKLQENLEISFQQGMKDKDEDLVLRCLRTYALIDKISNAEELFRHVIVSPYMVTFISEDTYQGIGLVNICAKVIQFVISECKLLLELTSEGGQHESVLDHKHHRVKGFDFLVNAIWPEICQSFEIRLPHIFSPGSPDLFLERYRVMMKFLQQFESLCTSYESFLRLRAHPSYQSFITKWSLPLYFQIRLQEIGGSLEEHLTKPLESFPEAPWKTRLFFGAWEAIEKSFDNRIYVTVLGGRFWKTYLQILKRTSNCMKQVVQDMSKGGHSEEDGTISVSEDKITKVKKLTVLHLDADCFIAKVKDFYYSTICLKLQEIGVKDLKDFEDAFLEACEDFSFSCAAVQSALTQTISEEGYVSLEGAKNVPRLYRRTNRETPTVALPYVKEALSTLRIFQNEIGSDGQSKQLNDVLTGAVTNMIIRYFSVVNELVTSIRKTEESLLRLKRQRKGGQTTQGATGTETSDESKIRRQLYLDCIELGDQLTSLDLKPDDFEQYKQLKDVLEREVKNESTT